MRGWGIVVVVASACTFAPRADVHDDGAAPGSSDSRAPSDAPPVDTLLGGPACLHDAAYVAGGPETTHRYRLVAQLMDRDTAFDSCAQEGAHLVVIDSAAENTFVASLAAPQAQAAWIGYADLVTEGAFLWIAPLTSSFTSWGSNQPDDGGSNGQAQDCAAIGSDASWDDTSCGDARPSVCECEDGYVAPVQKLCRTQAGWSTYAGRRYQQFGDSGNTGAWAMGEATCEQAQATLFVPSDLDEIEYATGSAGLNVNGSIWIGEYIDGSGSQAWIDGSPVVFQDWSSGPSHATTDCTEEGNSGSQRWTTHSCTDNHDYVCECDPDPPAPPHGP